MTGNKAAREDLSVFENKCDINNTRSPDKNRLRAART